MRVPVDDLLGWVASLLTLITFAQTNMLPLRVTAILANVFFIAYGAMGHVLPVLTLHAILLPLNSARLIAHVGTTSVDGRFRVASRRIAKLRAGDALAQNPNLGLSNQGCVRVNSFT
jgi:hypothetical protein